MKLGTETGSVVNHLYSRGTRGQPYPEVGMGATKLYWTDRYAATISVVFERGKYLYVGVQEDDATLIGGSGLSESQEYEYKPNPDAPTRYFRFNPKSEKWEAVNFSPETKRFKKSGSGVGLLIGKRCKYRDPHF